MSAVQAAQLSRRRSPAERPFLTERMTSEARRIRDEWPNTHRNSDESYASAHDISWHIGGSTYDWARFDLPSKPSLFGYLRWIQRCDAVADSLHSFIEYSGSIAYSTQRIDERKEKARLWTPEWAQEQRTFADDLDLLLFVDVHLWDCLWEFRCHPVPTQALIDLPDYRDGFRQGMQRTWDKVEHNAEFIRIQVISWPQEWDLGLHERAHCRLMLATEALRNSISSVRSVVEWWTYREQEEEEAEFLRGFPE